MLHVRSERAAGGICRLIGIQPGPPQCQMALSGPGVSAAYGHQTPSVNDRLLCRCVEQRVEYQFVCTSRLAPKLRPETINDDFSVTERYTRHRRFAGNVFRTGGPAAHKDILHRLVFRCRVDLAVIDDAVVSRFRLAAR